MNTVIRFFFGKEVALALSLLQSGFLLMESIRRGLTPNVGPFARELFRHLPAAFRHPQGPATEQEFVDAVYNVFALFIKNK